MNAPHPVALSATQTGASVGTDTNTENAGWSDATRPVNLLILALGGEGGGVLADWVVATAQACGLPVQATSVPGVAQRTGATSYYIEMLRTPVAPDLSPVFCLSPTPGDIDLLISSELLETGRALERGLTDPQRTVLISSTARFLTVAEKMAMGDGRLDASRIETAAHALCRRTMLFDMAQESRAAGTVISSVMFGAIAASAVLPLPREACEQTIRAGGLSVAASLAGFARGYDAALADNTGRLHPTNLADPANSANSANPANLANPADPASPAPAADAPAGEASLARLRQLGSQRVRAFQDAAYQQRYEQRLAAIEELERSVHASSTVSAEVARHLALWMAYDDLIRVADLKSRPERLQRIRQEVGAADHEPVVVREFFKPGVDEVAAILPPGLATRLRRWAGRRGLVSLSQGVRLQTSAVHGWLLLRGLASLRRWRPRSSRFQHEQVAIEGWLSAINQALKEPGAEGHRLAHEIAHCPRLLKGYGDTWARGRARFETLMTVVVSAPRAEGESAGARADRLRAAREAALRDTDGRQMASELGLPAPPAKVHPIRIVRRPR